MQIDPLASAETAPRLPAGDGAVGYPPALDAVRGGLWRAAWTGFAGSLALYGALLVRADALPGATRSPDGVPPFIIDAIIVIGFLVLAAGASMLRRVLVGASRALDARHAPGAVFEAVADRAGDTPRLAVGAGEYVLLPEDGRAVLRLGRVAAAGLAGLAALLPSVGALVAVLLAFARALGPGAAVALVLAPALVAAVLSLIAAGTEAVLLAGTRRAWAGDDAATNDHGAGPSSARGMGMAGGPTAAAAFRPDAGAVGDAGAAGAESAPDAPAPPSNGAARHAANGAARSPAVNGAGHAPPDNPRGVQATLVAARALLQAGVAAIGVCALAVALAARPGDVIIESAPRIGELVTGIAAAEAARPYRLPIDPSISPDDAGRVLAAISAAGRDEASPLFRPAEPRYDRIRNGTEIGVADHPFTPPVPSNRWIAVAAAGLSGEQLALLRGIAAQPALDDLTRIAPARSATLVLSSDEPPVRDGGPSWRMPVFTGFRRAGEAMIARAALELAEGRPTAAEASLRSVISAGLLLVDESPVPLHALVGSTAASSALAALRELYQATGRSAEADHIADLADAVRRGREITRSIHTAPTRPSEIAAIALADGAPRSLRWDAAMGNVIITECGSLRHRLFGESEAYREWKTAAHDALVRTPGEAALFELYLENPRRLNRVRRDRGIVSRATALASAVLPGPPVCTGSF